MKLYRCPYRCFEMEGPALQFFRRHYNKNHNLTIDLSDIDIERLFTPIETKKEGKLLWQPKTNLN